MQCTCGEQATELYLHSRCHPEEPTWAILASDGTISIVCAACDKEIAVFQTTGLAAKTKPKEAVH